MNKELIDPFMILPAALTDRLRGLAGEAERIGHLHPDQLAIIYERGWFNLYVPRAYGGLELSLPEGLRIEEELAWVDGSLGWTVTLCSGANWFVGFLRPELARELFADRRVCLAGSGRPDGVARVIGEEGAGSDGPEVEPEDGPGEGTGSYYEVTGSWKYATGAPHATAFTANCRIEKDGVLLENEDGSPVVRAFLFRREEVTIQEDWEVIGMIATASHSFAVRELRVGEDRCFRIDGRYACLPQPIYRYPFQAFAEATLAVNHSGMAKRFFELWKSDGRKPDRHPGQRGADGPAERGADSPMEGAGQRLQMARESFYAIVQASWEECVRGSEVPSELLTAVGEASRQLAGEARRLVDELYPYCGLRAASPGTEINRVWRDLHTASQHPLLRPATPISDFLPGWPGLP
jgi:alkylation response protein AidB-like acyl-CoA dehydrogenase